MKLDWIPQLFKDLIGRVVPGATVLLAACMVRAGHFSAVRSLLTTKNDEISVALLLIGLVVSYILGFSLSQIWWFTLGYFQKSKENESDKPGVVETKYKAERLKEHNHFQKEMGRKIVNLAPHDLPRIFVMHDHIRITLPRESNRLSKMQSEMRLCRSLLVGIGFLGAINLGLIFYTPTLERMIMEFVAVGIVLAAWRRERRMHEFYTNGVCVLWLSLASSDQLFKLPE